MDGSSDTLRRFTSKEAADQLGISERAVRKHAERHGIGEKHGRDWLFTEADLAQMGGRRRGPRG